MDSPDCPYDSVSVYDEDPPNQQGLAETHLIGAYCNTNQPPKHILSKWNHLRIEMLTDSSHPATGFWAIYNSVKYNATILSSVKNTSGKLPCHYIYMHISVLLLSFV